MAAPALTVGAACSAREETGVSTTQLDETARLASTAAGTATGITTAGIADTQEGISTVGGNASSTTSVSIGSTATLRAFTVCTGGGDLELDLAGTAQQLTSDGQVREVSELLVLGAGKVQLKSNRVNDAASASAWVLAFVPA